MKKLPARKKEAKSAKAAKDPLIAAAEGIGSALGTLVSALRKVAEPQAEANPGSRKASRTKPTKTKRSAAVKRVAAKSATKKVAAKVTSKPARAKRKATKRAV